MKLWVGFDPWCASIVNVISEQGRVRSQEMWLIRRSKHEEMAVYCTPTEWDQVLQSCEHAKECGWTAFMAQKEQDAHELLHYQIADLIILCGSTAIQSRNGTIISCYQKP